MKDQGLFIGDITPLQRTALHFATAYENSQVIDQKVELTKALQMFINPSLYQKVYGAELYEQEQEESFSSSDYQIDLSSPEDLDDYLERLYQQENHTKLVAIKGNQEVQIGT